MTNTNTKLKFCGQSQKGFPKSCPFIQGLRMIHIAWCQYKVKPNLMQTSGMRSHSAGTSPSLKVPPSHHLTAATNSLGSPASTQKKWSPFNKILVIISLHIIWIGVPGDISQELTLVDCNKLMENHCVLGANRWTFVQTPSSISGEGADLLLINFKALCLHHRCH